MNEFLNQAMTPIVNFVLNQPRSVPYLLSTIGYTLLKKVRIRKDEKIIYICLFTGQRKSLVRM